MGKNYQIEHIIQKENPAPHNEVRGETVCGLFEVVKSAKGNFNPFQ